MTKLRVLDLFSGIGGFSLGLERTGGFETVAFCEIEPFPRRVLAKHWPGVPIYEDVRELTADTLARDGIGVDVICGGFPCQDISLAGRRQGLDGERSGLWFEYARIIGELRPEFVIVENTPGLLSLGMGDVLGDLAALGYDAEWHCIPACYVGADHIRDRVWIIANHDARHGGDEFRTVEPQGKVGKASADALRPGLQRRRNTRENGDDAGAILPWIGLTRDAAPLISGEHRLHKPVLGRGIHGLPNRVDRIAALGNAVVPQIPELIGRAILEARQ